jgi:hypothetical protein
MYNASPTAPLTFRKPMKRNDSATQPAILPAAWRNVLADPAHRNADLGLTSGAFPLVHALPRLVHELPRPGSAGGTADRPIRHNQVSHQAADRAGDGDTTELLADQPD